jgi:hypothetical protein
MSQEQQQGDGRSRRRVWTPASVWKVIGITTAVAAAVVGLGVVGYVALVAIAVSSWGSNK